MGLTLMMAIKTILFLALCLLLVVVSVLTVSQDPVEVAKSRSSSCRGMKSGACQIVKSIVKLGEEVYEFFMQIVKGGCWPHSYHNPLTMEHLSYDEAMKHIEEFIAKDPENSICEYSWWFWSAYHILCTTTHYRGLTCGSGYHWLQWDNSKYQWREAVVKDLKHYFNEGASAVLQAEYPFAPRNVSEHV